MRCRCSWIDYGIFLVATILLIPLLVDLVEAWLRRLVLRSNF